ncbi:MAG: EAL domain-containing protein [Burkholderiales bacterium]|nr:EAL domain-containing protein [Burkholderiales bacterium]
MSELRSIGVNFALVILAPATRRCPHLKRLPLDQLKIDQSFVRDVLKDPNDAVIAHHLSLAQSLDLTLWPKRAETEGQRTFLLNSGARRSRATCSGARYQEQPALPQV